MAALALGLGVRVRPARADRRAWTRSITGWLVFEGHRRSLRRLTQLRRHASGRRAALRADDASVPGLRRAQRHRWICSSSSGWSRIREHIRSLHQPVLAWAERSGARITSPQGRTRLGHPVRGAGERAGGSPPAQGCADRLQPARGLDPAESALLQHGGRDGAGRARAGRRLSHARGRAHRALPGALRDPVSQSDRRSGRAGPRGGHLRRRAPARRPVPPRRGAARPRIAHALSDSLAEPAGSARWRAAARTVIAAIAGASAGSCCARWTRPVSGTGPGRWTSCDARRGSFRVRPYDVCYCAFGMDAPHALRLRRLGALAGQLVVAFRGADTTKYVARRGPRVYARTFREARLLLPVCEFLARRSSRSARPPSGWWCTGPVSTSRRWPYRERRSGCAGQPPAGDRRAAGREEGHRAACCARSALLVDRGVRRRVSGARGWPAAGRARARWPPSWESRIGSRSRGGKARRRCARDWTAADVLVAASVTAADGDEEGIPNVLKEAMASGMPVVGTRHAGIPELVEDGVSGCLVPERDEAALGGRARPAGGRARAMGRDGPRGPREGRAGVRYPPVQRPVRRSCWQTLIRPEARPR